MQNPAAYSSVGADVIAKIQSLDMGFLAAYTGLEQQLPQGYDFIFVARSRTAHCKMQPVQQAMLQQITALTAAPSAVREAGQT